MIKRAALGTLVAAVVIGAILWRGTQKDNESTIPNNQPPEYNVAPQPHDRPPAQSAGATEGAAQSTPEAKDEKQVADQNSPAPFADQGIAI